MLKWTELYKECMTCNKCSLKNSRTHIVFGEGNVNAKLVFVGEAPGADEDRTGRPFVGKAGQLLNKGLEALEIKREKDYYICNICKCRPENNRTPSLDEGEECLPYVRNQIALIKPKIIVCLGATAVKYILGDEWRITRDRGKWVERKGFLMTCTYHPSAVLRDSSKKRVFWEDLKEIKKRYEEIK